MTVIAWDGRTLAADKRTNFGSVVLTTTKLRKYPDGRLAGAAGPSGACRAALDWLADGGDPAKYTAEIKDVHLLMIRPDGSAWMFDGSAVPMRIEDSFCAIGSGMSEAMVAMACGKTAAEAVELTARYVSNCGNGVDTLTLQRLPTLHCHVGNLKDFRTPIPWA